MSDSHSKELVGTMAGYAMIGARIERSLESVFPHWKKLAEFALDFWSTDPEKLAKTLCDFYGVDPYQKSLGLGSLIEKDKPYELWEAQVGTARFLIYGWRVHNEPDHLNVGIPDAPG